VLRTWLAVGHVWRTNNELEEGGKMQEDVGMRSTEKQEKMSVRYRDVSGGRARHDSIA
jgi:hypothetical protein